MTTTVLTVLMLMPMASRAETADCKEAESLIEQGLKKRLDHEDKEALEAFLAAQQRCPMPRTLAQCALAEQALGLWVEAEMHLIEALAVRDDAWIDEHRQELGEALATVGGHLGDLDVEFQTPGVAEAELFLRGTFVAKLPLQVPLRVVAGTTVMEVRAPGFAPEVRQVRIPPRGHAREPVTLGPLNLTPHPSAPAASPAPPRLGWWRTLGIVGVAVGGLMLGGGVAAHVVREQNARAFNSDPACAIASGELPEPCQVRAVRLLGAERLAGIGYGVGGALAAGGIVLLALPGRFFLRERDRSVTLAPGPGQLGLGLRATF